MARFLKGSAIGAEIEKLIQEATLDIFLISPYIKLHNRIKSELRDLKKRPKVNLKIVFGKNEGNFYQSLNLEDLEFLKGLPNIEIRYAKLLHAKYYANEDKAILTSMNLYDFSQNNNIEFGILLKSNMVKHIVGDGLDNEAFFFFTEKVFQDAELVYHRQPKFERNLLGMKTDHIESYEIVDYTHRFEMSSKEGIAKKPAMQASPYSRNGFCIRTRVPIPFNPNRPLCDEAYKSWSQFSNKDYKEKYCHFSGESSNGETSVKYPILKKNWQKAKEVHGL